MCKDNRGGGLVMKIKKILLAIGVLLLVIGFASCGNNDQSSEPNDVEQNNTGEQENNAGENDAEDSGEPVELHVAALKSAYGDEAWKKIVADYEEANENVTVKLTIEKNLEEVVRPQMQAGDYPDVFLL